ncbi:uncharacterized protein BKA78DRAFT_182581 [Phyllosticta capitalensis]|uniref:uncharacterized protein n=1 Tax=Phyllosticta capitalensis TaxID=121624 RepID=UPI00313134E7
MRGVGQRSARATAAKASRPADVTARRHRRSLWRFHGDLMAPLFIPIISFKATRPAGSPFCIFRFGAHNNSTWQSFHSSQQTSSLELSIDFVCSLSLAFRETQCAQLVCNPVASSSSSCPFLFLFIFFAMSVFRQTCGRASQVLASPTSSSCWRHHEI